jgi:hypothetical protein
MVNTIHNARPPGFSATPPAGFSQFRILNQNWCIEI